MRSKGIMTDYGIHVSALQIRITVGEENIDFITNTNLGRLDQVLDAQ
jgi:hypothetical protein